ncbi:heptaprenyl diphosphate synthase component 1 [Metabacillus malikii]|uniref:Heptaprenyl diphosphate synthase n=1 Tax=Metabacillus malikii TaxID=1504265 RepID=A0ABT9ZMC6_9BACI|nr:heptaprenyl diphosphate synthase component 1 [Metabacillus malikii]MDQ0232957.1 heptaprenyl diphosphate synthase [Metabacillus malikii]
MQDIYVKLTKIKSMLQKKLSHPFLEQYLSTPEIDDDKLLLLYAIFDEIELPSQLKERYIMTAMLVQIALDTHDKVTVDKNINHDAFVERQLTALAGDYYSGLYYGMLSELKDIQMIRVLAEAIKEINENKIKLYHDKELSVQTTMESVLIVETALFQKITQHYKLDFWNLFSTKFLTYKKLSHEKFHNEEKIATLELSKMKQERYPINSLKRICELFYDDTVSLLDACLIKTPSIKELLFKRVQNIRLHEKLDYKKTVEEGLS